MSIIKLSKENVIQDKIQINKSQISYDAGAISQWEKQIKTASDEINNYFSQMKTKGYLTTDELEKYKSSMDTYIDLSDRIRSVNKMFGGKLCRLKKSNSENAHQAMYIHTHLQTKMD